MTSSDAGQDAVQDPGPRRLRRLAIAAVAAAAVAALALGGTSQRIGGAGLLLVIGVHSVPWRLPRRDRSVASYWVESVSMMLPGILALVVALLAGAHVGGAEVTAPGLALGVAVGLAVAATARMPLRMLVRGDVARIVGWDKPGHALARGSLPLAGGPLEEVLYRGLLLPSGGAALPLLAVTSGVAFVASHFLLRGMPRVDRGMFVTLTAGAAGFTALTLVTGSLVPAVVAHLVANAPRVTLELQRAWLSRTGEIEPELEFD